MLNGERVAKIAPYPFFSVPEENALLQKLNQGWERWDLTRRTNPYIDEQSATGFEGYFVGLSYFPQRVANEIAELGAKTLESIQKLHRHNPDYLRKLWKVARGEIYDHKLLFELNSYLLSNLARLRVQIHPYINPVGDAFRNQVAMQVEHETIEYLGETIVEKHLITIPKVRQQTGTIQVTDQLFSKDQLREGYEFMKLLGKSGYPLVQLSIKKYRYSM